MTYRLPALLTTADFSATELSALLLDGAVYRVGECFSAIDVMPSPQLRAASLATVLPDRLIVERLSAAWVWGALTDPPPLHQVCVDISSRLRPVGARRYIVREVVIAADELADFGGVQVTTPLRTALDLARNTTGFTEEDVVTIARLMQCGGFGTEATTAALNRRRNLPNKKVASERFERAARAAQRLPVVVDAAGADPLAVGLGADPVDVVHGIDPAHRVEDAVHVGGVAHLEHKTAEGQSFA